MMAALSSCSVSLDNSALSGLADCGDSSVIGLAAHEASSQPVAMGTVLADIMRLWQRETSYSKPQDWVFPSFKLRGRKPRTGSIMAQDYLRPAAVKEIGRAHA